MSHSLEGPNRHCMLTEPTKLNLDGILGRKIRVRAGEPIDIRIPITGAPVPKVEWAHAGKPLAPGGRAEASSGTGSDGNRKVEK